VPRQLQDLSFFINITVNAGSVPASVDARSAPASVNAASVDARSAPASVVDCDTYFKSKFPDKKDPVTRLNHFLSLFDQEMTHIFKGLHASYYTNLPESDKPGFMKMSLDVLTFSTDTFATPQYPT
jgi:hypothetical protein